MKPLALALILTFPLTCFAGPWSKLIASTIDKTIVISKNETVCENDVCIVRKEVQKATVVTSVQKVRKVRYRQITRKRILRRPLFARHYRCCRR